MAEASSVNMLLKLLLRGSGARATSATGLAAEIRGFLQTRGIGGAAGAAKAKKIIALLQDPLATQSQIAGAIGKNMQWSQIPANLRGQFSTAMTHGHRIGFKTFVDANAPKELRVRLKAKANQATIPEMRSTAKKIQTLGAHQREALQGEKMAARTEAAARGAKVAQARADAAVRKQFQGYTRAKAEIPADLQKQMDAVNARQGAATRAASRPTAAAAKQAAAREANKSAQILSDAAKRQATAGVTPVRAPSPVQKLGSVITDWFRGGKGVRAAKAATASATGAQKLAAAGVGAGAPAGAGAAAEKTLLESAKGLTKKGAMSGISGMAAKLAMWIAPYLITREVLAQTVTGPAQSRLQEAQMAAQQQAQQAQTPGAFQSTQQMINEALMPLQAQRTQAAFQGVMQTPGAGADLIWE